VNFSGAKLERRGFQRLNSGVRLGDVAGFEQSSHLGDFLKGVVRERNGLWQKLKSLSGFTRSQPL
jgi:hypothetical protein